MIVMTKDCKTLYDTPNTCIKYASIMVSTDTERAQPLNHTTMILIDAHYYECACIIAAAE